MEFLLAIHGADGGEEHAVGIQAHHLARGEVQDGGDLFSHELFGLVEGVNAGEDLAGGAGAVVEAELQQLLRFLDGLAGEDLDDAHVAAGEVVDADVREDRVDGGRRAVHGPSGRRCAGRGFHRV